MKKLIYIPALLLLFAFNCKKDTIKLPEPEPLPTIIEKQDSIYFIFINKIGYKNDSVNISGGGTRYLGGICLNSGYYNVKLNKSNLLDVCYGRNKELFTLKDSIKQISYPCYINSQYNLIVDFTWYFKKQFVSGVARTLTFQENTLGNDTVKTKGDKIIKFVWPDDTASGKFAKTWDSFNH